MLRALARPARGGLSAPDRRGAERRPILEGEVEAGKYARELSSREDFGAGVTLEIPLDSGGRVAAEVARRRPSCAALQAEQDEARLEVRAGSVDTWQELQTLQTQREEVRTLLAYRDLDLDRRRALVRTGSERRPGRRHGGFTAARLREAQTTYAMVVARARLRALTGDRPGRRRTAGRRLRAPPKSKPEQESRSCKA